MENAELRVTETSDIGNEAHIARYNALMDIVRNRVTTRAFDPNFVVPREHYGLILDAARHAPSGAKPSLGTLSSLRRPK